MRAAVLYSPFKIKIEEKPILKINSGEVLIKTKAAAICGSDVRLYRGEKKANLPRTIGHEFSGEVVSVGKQIKSIHCGDRVTIQPVISCGSCTNCRKGKTNICLKRKVIGYDYEGGFAEYIRIPKEGISNICVLPKTVSYEIGALAEPYAACLNGIKKLFLEKLDSVLVIGTGPIGLMLIQLIRNFGVDQIFVSDPLTERLEISLKFGADYTINPTEIKLSKFVLEKRHGLGFDKVVITAGKPDLLGELLEVVNKGGIINIFAGCPPNSIVRINPNHIHYGEITVNGSESSTVDQMKEILTMMEKEKINPELLITQKFSLEQIEQAIKCKAENKILKPLIVL